MPDVLFDNVISSDTPDIHASNVRPDVVQEPPKTLTGTAWKSLGTHEFDGTNIERVRGAFGESYDAAPPSITRPGQRSFFYPDVQESMNQHWWGPAVNVLGDTAGTALAGLSGIGNSALTLGNETLRAMGLPESLIRDLNLELLRRSGEPFKPGVTPVDRPWLKREAELNRQAAADAAELKRPPTPSVVDVFEAERNARRANVPPDAATAAAIDLLKRRNMTEAQAPAPPQPWKGPPFKPTETQPTPPPPGVGYARLPTDASVAERMAMEARGWYSPADEQAARGATINPAAADRIRSSITDRVPLDPEEGTASGNTSLIQLGKDMAPHKGQPMTYAAAMQYDVRLTAERQAALNAGNKKLAEDIGNAQSALRERMQDLGEGDTSGDASTLANLPNARKAHSQRMKQMELEDIEYDASLLAPDKQDAYRRQRMTALLRNDKKMRSWSDDERGALEAQLRAGQIGPLKNLALSFVRPAAGAVGGGIGGAVGGPGGAFIGGQTGAELGGIAESALRRRLGQITLDPVTAQLLRNMPPPPPARP